MLAVKITVVAFHYQDTLFGAAVVVICLCCHRKSTGIVFSLREAFHDYSHISICCFIVVQHARCEEISVSISISQNASQTAFQAF